MIEIRSRWDSGKVLLRSETAATIKEAVEEVIKAEPHQNWLRGEEGGARANFADANFAGANFAGANFAGADFARADFARADFADADFADANFAGANFARADFARADFARADFADANFADANFADADFADADFAGADFADANFADANFADAYFAGADFADADFADANFAGADFADADFAGANFAGANFAGAKNVPIGVEKVDPPEPYVRQAPTGEALAERARRYRERHPEVPVVANLDAKILHAVSVEGGVLQMSLWHGAGGVCGTTHCRAGWAIHLAGKAGHDLERRFGSQHAGAMIYRASTGRVPHFFATDARALEDIKRCARADGNT